MGLYRDETGQIIEVPDSFADARGYTPVNPVDIAAINEQRGVEARGTERGALGALNAGLTGFESALTFGGSDVLLGKTLTPFERERVQSEIEAHPYIRAAGEIGGALASTLPTLGATPAGYLGNLTAQGIERGLEAGGAKGVSTALAAMGAEGAAQSAGQYIGHSALEDHEITAEGLTGSLGTGFAFGAGGGGAALGVIKGTVAARRMFSRVMEGEKAAKAAESTWTLASQEALEADGSNALAAQTKLDNLSKAKRAAAAARNEARNAASEANLDAQIARGNEPKPEGNFEASIPTDVISREKPAGGMPTSVFKRPGELEGPNPLVDSIAQPQGEATSVFKPKAAEASPVETPAPAAPTSLEVTRDGRKLLVNENGVQRELASGEGDKLARAMLPEGFTLGTLDTRTPFQVKRGVPAPEEIGKNSLYVVRPSELAERGVMGNVEKAGGKASIGEAWGKGTKLAPVDINVTPGGKLFIEDGNHRLLAAAEAGDKPVAVNFKRVGEDFKPQASAVDVTERLRGGATTDLEAQLAGTKAKLDEGKALKDIPGENAVPGSPVSPQVPPGKMPPEQPGRAMASSSINDWLSEKASFDNGELSFAKKVEDIRGANDLRMRRQETLSDIRFRQTEDLLGSAVAKEERRVAGVLEEYNAARKDVEELMAAPANDFAPEATPGTVKGGPGNRKAIEILDDAHEEALLRGKHAADPQEAGQAFTEAEELEKMLENIAEPRLTPGQPMSAAELRSPHSKAWAEDLVNGADKIARYEKASAALAEEMGDAAHPVSIEKTKAHRAAEKDAERKVYDRTARATDDANDGVTTPKQRAQDAKRNVIEKQRALDDVKAQHADASAESRAANKKLAAGEKMKREALRFDAKAARAGAKAGVDAQDVGGLLEIADIPGLPKPSDLPVVGPLLGAYLKYRALRKAMGRAMGRVPATAEAKAAVVVSRQRDRVARAVDRSLGLMEKGARAVAPKVPAIAGVLASRIYDDGGPDAKKGAGVQELAATRIRELASYVHTPGAIERDVRRELAGITDPDLIAATEKQRRVQMEYLLKNAPTVPEQSILNKIDYLPGPAQAMSFGRRMEAVFKPEEMFERLAYEQTMLSLEAAHALREVYPRMFQDAQQRLLQRASEKDLRVPNRTRVQLSLLYQVPLDTSLDPVNLKITQSVYERKAPAPPSGMPGAAPVPPPTPTIAAPVNIAQDMTTALDRR